MAERSRKLVKIKQYKKLNNTTALKKAHSKLTKWFNLYIRLKNLWIFQNTSHCGIVGECFTCGATWEVELFSDKSILNGKKWHCGHFYKSDRHESVRYDERNCALQCYNCNKNLSGNESAFSEYLKKKLGAKGFELLKQEKNKIKKYNIIELENLIDIYKLKAKTEANRLQIRI